MIVARGFNVKKIVDIMSSKHTIRLVGGVRDVLVPGLDQCKVFMPPMLHRLFQA